MIMAPMTRARSGPDRAPTPMVAQYYEQRAGAGMQITEATSVSRFSVSRPGASAMYTDAHQAGWRRVAARVHARGGVLYQQLYHLGRKADPSRMPEGAVPVSSSAIQCPGHIQGNYGKITFAVPRPLETGEIPGIVEEFRQAALRCKAAGVDGVEVHGANGYLLDQFLRNFVNQRTDRYGGGVENRARFLLEVVDAVTGVFGADRVGVRVSPHYVADGCGDSDPAALYTYVAHALSARHVSYLHLIEGANKGPTDPTALLAPLLRREFKGTFMLGGGYDQASGEAVLQAGGADFIAYGILFICNPDLVERFSRNGPFNEQHPDSYYNGDARGYIDYPTLDGAIAHAEVA